MKTFVILMVLFFNLSPRAVASDHSVEKYLPNIQDRVRQCSILPFIYNQHQNRVEHSFRSHCPEVKVIAVENGYPMAKIRVAGQQFMARLLETEFSDGDFFDVEIRNLRTEETYRIDNVLAFGDILRGILGGNTGGVATHLVTE